MAGDQKKFQVAMAHANKFVQQANWTEASRAFRFALAEFPNSEAAILGFGKASLRLGQPDFAQRAFQQVLKVNSTNQEAMSLIGELHEQAGEVDAAAEMYLRLGNMNASQLDLPSAIHFWRKAISLVPNHLEAHRRLADGLAQHGDTRPAARQLLTLAAIFQQQGSQDQAQEQIQAAEQLVAIDDPAIAEAYQALQTGTPIQPEQLTDTPPDTPEVVDDFFSAALVEDTIRDGGPTIEDDPFAISFEDDVPKKGLVSAAQENAIAELADSVFEGNTDPMQMMMIVQAIDLQGSGNLREAAKNYHQVIQGGAKDPALYFNLGMLLKELGQLDQAVELLKFTTQQTSEYQLGAQFALGETYLAANQQNYAVRCFFEGVKLVDTQLIPTHRAETLTQQYSNFQTSFFGGSDPQKLTLFIEAVQSFFAHPAWEKKAFEARQLMDGVNENGSIMSLAEFLETPQTEVVITAMALTSQYLNRKMLRTASEECLRAIQRAPQYLPLHVRLADILLQQERTDEAVSKYLCIARVFEMRGTPGEAIDVFQKVLRTAPMDVKVRSELIGLYQGRGDTEQALEHLLILADSFYQLAQVDRALQKYNEASQLATSSSDPNQWKAKILGRVGDIYTQRFDWAGATKAYEELVRIKPNDDAVQRKLIDFYFKQNKVSQASEILNTVLTQYQRQDPAKAVELLKDLRDSRPDDMNLRQRLAQAYVQNGMTREAIAEYDALGEMQLEQGLRDKAIQTIQAIIQLGPEDSEGYRRLLSQISGGAL